VLHRKSGSRWPSHNIGPLILSPLRYPLAPSLPLRSQPIGVYANWLGTIGTLRHPVSCDAATQETFRHVETNFQIGSASKEIFVRVKVFDFG